MGIRVKLVSVSLAFSIFLFTTCSDDVDTTKNTNENEESEETEETEVVESVDFNFTIEDALYANKKSHYDSEDYVWNSSDEVIITLNGTSISVNGAGASATGCILTITNAGTYKISGSLTDGRIIVNSSEDGMVRLILSGVDINCSSSSPIFIENADEAMIVLAEGTENILSDGSTYSYTSDTIDEPNATIFSKSDLTFYGKGSLTVNGNYNDAIASKDGLIIKSGIISVYAADDGIRGKDYLIVNGGSITVDAMGDGLKSDNDADTARGYIYLEAGQFEITALGDALAAQTDVLIADADLSITSGGGSSNSVTGDLSAKGIKGLVNVIIDGNTLSVNSADDAIHSNGNVVINGGTIDISTADDGIHAETAITINSGDLTIAKSYEGIESASITINNGKVNITASDDGFNASKGNGGETNDGSLLNLNGGTIYVNASGGDGLDCNGSVSIKGGTIVVHGPQSNPEVGMDYNGTCNITGGFLVITGTNSNMTQGASSTSTQYCLKLITTSNNAAGSLIHIEDSEGNNILTFKPLRSYYSIVLSSPDLKNGSTYTIYTGGSSTGTELNGLYMGGEYTPGTQYTSFTISGILTNIGSSSGGPGPGGW